MAKHGSAVCYVPGCPCAGKKHKEKRAAPKSDPMQDTKRIDFLEGVRQQAAKTPCGAKFYFPQKQTVREAIDDLRRIRGALD